MVDYKVQAELEYSKLLDSDSVNPELLEHDMFYEKFMESYYFGNSNWNSVLNVRICRNLLSFW